MNPPTVGLVKIPNSTVNYYEIHGSTENELRQQLDTLGPIDKKGQRNDASTKWYVRRNWPGLGSSSCSLKDATIKLDIQVIFPHWSPTSSAPPEFVKKWINYTHNLAVHDTDHVDNVVENYQKMLTAIKGAT